MKKAGGKKYKKGTLSEGKKKERKLKKGKRKLKKKKRKKKAKKEKKKDRVRKKMSEKRRKNKYTLHGIELYTSDFTSKSTLL